MKWIGTGVVSIAGKDYGHGDDIPHGKIDRGRLQSWKKQGLVGDLPEKINHEALKSEELDSLREENADLQKSVKKLSADLDKSKKASEVKK